MERRLVCLVVFALVAWVGVAAQAAVPAASPSVETKLLSLELGLPIGYRLSDGALVSGRSFALGIAVADNFSVGISSTQIGTTAPLTAYNALRLSYTILPYLGASIYVGQAGANTAAGLGIYTTLVPVKTLAGLSTSLRLKIDYLFDTTAMSGGSVVFTTAMLFGI